MKDSLFGDSYDIVKRFFISELKAIGYHVMLDPHFTSAMKEEKQFYHFVGASDQPGNKETKTAVFLDPDTGINANYSGITHVSPSYIIKTMNTCDIVLIFDQSFGRNEIKLDKMREKLSEVSHAGGSGFYYDSHASFLFAAKEASSLLEIKERLIKSGLPKRKLIALTS